MSTEGNVQRSVAAREGVERYDDAPEPETGTQRPETPWPPPKPGQHESAFPGVSGRALPGENVNTGRGGLEEFFVAAWWFQHSADP